MSVDGRKVASLGPATVMIMYTISEDMENREEDAKGTCKGVGRSLDLQFLKRPVVPEKALRVI